MTGTALTIDDAVFAVVDVETTGLEPEWGHRVCEVATLVLQGGNTIGRFSSLVNPGRPIEPSAALVNHLTDADVAEAPPMAAVLPQLAEMLRGRVLVAYNASFDVGFLRNEFRIANLELPPFRVVDVMALAKRLLPELGRYPLVRVVRAVGLDFPAPHRAMSDVEATAATFVRFLETVTEQGVGTVDELEAITLPNSPAAEALRRGKIDVLTRAIDAGRRVHLVYRARDAALSERDVTPLELRTFAGRAQLVGFCHLRNAERTFSVDSMQDVQIVE